MFPWKVMPFGVSNAPALFQKLMNKILYILRCRPLVQELVSRAAEMEAHIDDVRLGTNTQEDHILLLQEVFTVCQENHLRVKLKRCEFMREEMEYLDQPLAMHQQGRGLFPGVEEEYFLYQLPGGTPP